MGERYSDVRIKMDEIKSELLISSTIDYCLASRQYGSGFNSVFGMFCIQDGVLRGKPFSSDTGNQTIRIFPIVTVDFSQLEHTSSKNWKVR